MELMTSRWKYILITSLFFLCLTAIVTFNRVTAAQAVPGTVKTPAMDSAPASGFSIPDTVSAINSDKPMSQRVVHYEIDAKYDATKHTIDATETLTYHNLTGQPLDSFPFHLYQNAFQPNATFVRDAKLMGTRDTGYDHWDSKEYGSEEIKSFEVVGQGDLTKDLHYIAPDDGNKDDKTVVEVRLPKPIPANAFVQFKIAFHDQMP